MPEQGRLPSPTTSEIAAEEEVKQAQKAFEKKRQEKHEAREREECEVEKKHIAEVMAAAKAEKACRKAEWIIRKAKKQKVAEPKVEENTSLMKKQKKFVNNGNKAIITPKTLHCAPSMVVISAI
jgi:hypothetical protein